MESHSKSTVDVPKWSALLVEAVNKPGLMGRFFCASPGVIRMAGSEAFLVTFAAGHPNGESFSVYGEKLPPGVQVQGVTQSGADLPGIGLHWEMWLHSIGGMKNHDVLRAATIWSADAIAHSKDFGSIEPSKLADMVILDANPLDNIHNTLKLKWVMKNGKLYEPFTLERVEFGDQQSQK